MLLSTTTETPQVAPGFALFRFPSLWSLYGETSRQTLHDAGSEVPMAAYALATARRHVPRVPAGAMPCRRALGVFASLSQTF